MLQQSNHTVKSALEKIRCDGISKGRETCKCFLMEKIFGEVRIICTVVLSLSWLCSSLVPRHHPVFDRLQYAKTEGKGLVSFIT